jgi:hypothetical protein
MKRLPLLNEPKLLFKTGEFTKYPKTYYTFDTEQQYDAFIKQLKEVGDVPYVNQSYFDVDISCEPQVLVSDGFACYGGKTLKAKGCKRCWLGSCSPTSYYINPATIEEYHDNPTEHYWV